MCWAKGTTEARDLPARLVTPTHFDRDVAVIREHRDRAIAPLLGERDVEHEGPVLRQGDGNLIVTQRSVPSGAAQSRPRLHSRCPITEDFAFRGWWSSAQEVTEVSRHGLDVVVGSVRDEDSDEGGRLDLDVREAAGRVPAAEHGHACQFSW